jgi:hypothetical protein
VGKVGLAVCGCCSGNHSCLLLREVTEARGRDDSGQGRLWALSHHLEEATASRAQRRWQVAGLRVGTGVGTAS